jgi:uncharacterized membrane protein YhaH (DUF805 family)
MVRNSSPSGRFRRQEFWRAVLVSLLIVIAAAVLVLAGLW